MDKKWVPPWATNDSLKLHQETPKFIQLKNKMEGAQWHYVIGFCESFIKFHSVDSKELRMNLNYLQSQVYSNTKCLHTHLHIFTRCVAAGDLGW